MNILTTIPDESVPAWQVVVDKFNAGSGNPPVTIEQFAQIFRDEETARYVAAKADADKLALVPLANALNAADPTTRDEVIAYAMDKLGLKA